MLEHLVAADPKQFVPEIHTEEPPTLTPAAQVGVRDMLGAKIETTKFLEGLGLPPDSEVEKEAGRASAREAFVAMAGAVADEDKLVALASVDSPAAVKHLVSMLTAYDWNFVEQAAEIRGYTLSKIMLETKHPDARIRLKALEMLGKVTEVALFTDRVEVKQTGPSDEELEKQLREKLERFMGTAQQVSDADIEVPKIEEAK